MSLGSEASAFLSAFPVAESLGEPLAFALHSSAFVSSRSLGSPFPWMSIAHPSNRFLKPRKCIRAYVSLDKGERASALR